MYFLHSTLKTSMKEKQVVSKKGENNKYRWEVRELLPIFSRLFPINHQKKRSTWAKKAPKLRLKLILTSMKRNI